MGDVRASEAPRSTRRLATRIAIGLGIFVLAVLLLLGALPVGLMRGAIEARLSRSLGVPVQVGSIARDSIFSYTPTITINDVRIPQPTWAGQGDFVRLRSAALRVPVFKLLAGKFKPDRVAIDGLAVALVRTSEGRENWRPDPKPAEAKRGDKPSLSSLTITNARFSLRDDKRGLAIAGPLRIDAARGLGARGTGTFLGTPATLDVTGGRIAGIAPGSPYPFAARITSLALDFTAKGVMAGALNTDSFTATITARAPTLKNVDRIIEAGLFGSQPVDLNASIRHEGRDWFIDRIAGSMGRSRFVGHATVLKRDGRTAIDAMLRASQFDFEDLSDDAGRAEAAARQKRVGDRVIPFTRINLSKLGKTDGRIAFTVDRLLSRPQTMVRSLKGVLALDHRVVTVSGIDAAMTSGHITGRIGVDHRSGAPKLSLDLRIMDTTLEALIGKPDAVDGRVRARVLLAGSGETVREALAHADGKAALVAGSGSVKTIIADVLGQNLSGAVSHAIGHPSGRVPLQCLIADFRARGGVLTPEPIAIQTSASIGRGGGRILLDGETIALTLTGSARGPTSLRIVDPIRVTGTLSDPSISVAGIDAGKRPATKGVLKVLGRSVKAALGIGRRADMPEPPRLPAVDCARLTAAALR